MSDEKLKIIQMVQDGKINAVEALELLKALDESENKAEIPVVTPSGFANRFLRIRVSSAGTVKVNVNIPLSLIRVASKFSSFAKNYIPESAYEEMAKKGINLSNMDIEELFRVIEQGLVEGGKIADIEVNDPHEGLVKVEIYVEK